MKILPLMALIATLVLTPFHAVSSPTHQAWVRRRGQPKRGLSSRFFGPDGRLRGLAGGAVATKAEQLREEAAAKFKEANDHIEEAVKAVGKTVDDLKADESIVDAEVMTKFDALMAEGLDLREQYEAAAKSEGRWEGLRDSLDYFHGKATGRGRVPWGQVTQYQPKARKTLGQQFVESESYRAVLAQGVFHNESAKFVTARICEAGDYGDLVQTQEAAAKGDAEAQEKLRELAKATSDIIHSGSGNEGDALILDQFLPGILALPQRPLTIRALFGAGQATSDTVSYAAQLSFESGAAAVAQATSADDGAKPQSSLSWERRTRPVETIATFMAATRQQLADAPQTEALIDNQGRLMLQIAEEDQLLSGSGASPNLQGVLGETGVQTLAVAVGATADAAGLNNLKAIRTAKRMVATGGARMTADALVMNPNDSEEFDLLTDNDGLFRGGNPVGNFTFNQGLWGLRRVESEGIAEGTVLVGAFKAGATVLERMPITVYTTDSHSDWFVRNLIAVLFEERLGFPIFYPAAFVKMTLCLWEGGS